MPKPQLLKSVARRVKMWKAVLLLALTVVLVFAGLRDREDPVYPGVQIYSKSTGEICSAGIPVYPKSGGSIGFIIASHCTDPSGPGNYVYQPIFSWWSRDRNWAGFSIDRGTDKADEEPDKSKPDAAIWVVANRGVSGKVPLDLCPGLKKGMLSNRPVWLDDQEYVRLPNIYKIGRSTYCTGTSSQVTLILDPRFSGKVFTVPITSLYIEKGDSGGIVVTVDSCDATYCYVRAVGTIVGGTPKDRPIYTAIQAADYSLEYYGLEIYTGG
jgi:hypothetical protein